MGSTLRGYESFRTQAQAEYARSTYDERNARYEAEIAVGRIRELRSLLELRFEPVPYGRQEWVEVPF